MIKEIMVVMDLTDQDLTVLVVAEVLVPLVVMVLVELELHKVVLED